MGRELLFVDYRLQDAHVRDVLTDTTAGTRELGATAPHMATVLDVEPAAGDPIARVVRVALQRDDEAAVASRRLAVFFDRVAWAAASVEASWMLDERYDDLVSTPNRDTVSVLRTMGVPDGSHWAGVRRLLGASGRKLP